MRLCSSTVCVCACVCFHPLDGKDGPLLFISPWLQDYRDTARKAVWQQVADAKMVTKICILAHMILVSSLHASIFHGLLIHSVSTWKYTAQLLMYLLCSLPFPQALPLSPAFIYFFCSLWLVALGALASKPWMSVSHRFTTRKVKTLALWQRCW